MGDLRQISSIHSTWAQNLTKIGKSEVIAYECLYMGQYGMIWKIWGI